MGPSGVCALIAAGSAARRAKEGRKRVADQPARIHDANEPSEITPRGWWRIVVRTFLAIGETNLSVAAAGVAFYSFLSIFPALGLTASIYGYLASPSDVQNLLSRVRDMLPYQSRAVIEAHLERLAETPDQIVGLALAASLALGLWSTTAAIRALMMALNIAYREYERRSFLRFHVQALVITAICVFFAITVFTFLALLPALFLVLGAGKWYGVFTMLRWPALAGIAIVALGVLYSVGPSRREARWSWVSWGAVVATALWLGATWLFSAYAANFAGYSESFGSLGAVVGLLVWFFVSAYCVLFGAVLNAEMELQTVRDTTVGPPRPMGERDAFVADHVAD